MAEDTEKQTQPDAGKKRRLRTNTETVRERTQKLQQESEKPRQKTALSSFWTGFTWPLRKLAALISKLGRFRVFRIIGRILFPKYLRNSIQELRLVTWPDRSTTFRLTQAVIIFSVIFGLIIAAVDFVLNKIFKELIIQ